MGRPAYPPADAADLPRPMLGFSGGGKPKESDEEKEYGRLAVFVENYDPAGEQMVDELKDAGEEETDECIPPLAIVNGECIGDPEADPMPPAVKRACDADQRSFTCAQYKLRVRERRAGARGASNEERG